MRQQINLYQPIFTEARQPLSAMLAGAVLGLVIVGLAGYSAYKSSQLGALKTEVETLRSEQVAQDALLTATGEQQATRAKPAEIDARITVLEHAITERSAALKVLQSGAAGQTSGFAERMEALARRHVEGLWIDKLVLSGTNGAMTMSGATLNADIVPEYLRSLAREQVLSGTRFDDFIIERPAKQEAQADAPSDAAEGEAKKHGPAFIRFRAGSRALTSTTAPEAAT